MPPVAPPYTKTLSALRKTELVRLSHELRLPAEGSVLALRNRLKAYLNAHSEVLYRNPRFRALYPKHRQIQLQPAVVPQRSVSPARSFDSWHGIDANRPRSPSLPLRSPQRSPSPTPPQSPLQYHNHFRPPSDDGLPLQDEQPLVNRRFFLSPFRIILCLLFSIDYLSLLSLSSPLLSNSDPLFCPLFNILLRVSCATTSVVRPRYCFVVLVHRALIRVSCASYLRPRLD